MKCGLVRLVQNFCSQPEYGVNTIFVLIHHVKCKQMSFISMYQLQAMLLLRLSIAGKSLCICIVCDIFSYFCRTYP